MNNLKKYIRNIPNFPKKGIIFRDITTLLKNAKAFKNSIAQITNRYKNKKIDTVVGIDARGFILGGAIAYNLSAGFVPARKKGKLPYKTHRASYKLEYGTDTLEIHKDSIKPNQRVLIVDDLLATGGTTSAVAKLVERLGGNIVDIVYLIELTDLNGRDRLKKYPIYSLIKY